MSKLSKVHRLVAPHKFHITGVFNSIEAISLRMAEMVKQAEEKAKTTGANAEVLNEFLDNLRWSGIYFENAIKALRRWKKE